MKCNDDNIILKVLNALETNFDCASKGEIFKMLNLGVSPERIIFANPMKPASHIKLAKQYRVDTMTFDSDFELLKIKKIFPEAKLILRVRCDAAKVQCPLGNKFGCETANEAPTLIKLARDEGMNLIGVSFHVGSGCKEPPVFRRAIKIAHDLFEYAKELGFNCNFLDIGGGFPGEKEMGGIFEEIAEIVNKAIEEYFPDPNMKIIAEPGRFFVASAYTLACNIHSKKVLLNPKGEVDHVMYFITDGVYGSFNCVLYDHQVVHPVILKTPDKNAKYTLSTVWGPSCDALDIVLENILLPEMEIGEWMFFENMGAYTLPIACPFNGFALPTVKHFVSKIMWDKIQ